MGRRVSYDEAVHTLLPVEGLIFGPLTDAHRRAAEQGSHDDAPEDRRALGLE